MKALRWIIAICLLSGCAAKIMQYDKVEDLNKVAEYDQPMQIKEISPTEAQAKPAKGEETKPPEETTKKAKRNKKRRRKGKKIEKEEAKSTVHLPDIEDGEGFVARRPVVDPFRVGEKVVLNLSYFNIVAGTLTTEVKPFVEAYGEKAYHFVVSAVSNGFFSHIYAVDDTAETYVSYENLIPFNLAINLKESKQLAESRTLFDWKEVKAHYWKRRVTKEHGEEEKKLDWDIKTFSQNVVSAAFYLRTFTFKVGKKLAMRVVDEGKNIVFTAEVIRKEVLDTDIGKLPTVVIRPKIEVDGVFAPVGEILIWLTDDDRKFMVRAETKIRIGTLVGKVKSIDAAGDWR